MVWRAEDPQGQESEKIKWELVRYTRGRGLDIGCGISKPFHHFIGVDNGHHAREFGWDVQANIVCETAEKLDLVASQSCDFVFSSHLLEHIQDYKKALREWWRVLKPGGNLCLYLPHKEFYPNIGQPGANPDHKHDFLPQDIIDAMIEIGGWDLIENQERNEGVEYSFFQVYKKLSSDRQRYSYKVKPKQPTCCVVRYGGIGDMIQTSSIFPELKKLGYHLTVMTTPNAHEIIKHDPHVDEFYLQDPDQVPNADLYDFWQYTRKKFDKWVNLSGSVEQTMLSIGGSPVASMPKAVRHKLCNYNYLELTHDIAEVPHNFHQKFYPTPEERAWAKKEHAKLGGKIVFWSLSGSAVHKAWPHTDTVIARLMLETDYRVVLAGDSFCKVLEQGWENEPRVKCVSGEWKARESLAFAETCDIIIGPETGMLNAFGLSPIPKIIMLSHSSHENLTKHWNHAFVLAADHVPCYPCHMMHYGFRDCREQTLDGKPTGASECAYQIGPDAVWSAIMRIEEWLQAA